jgi:hypothetical protein
MDAFDEESESRDSLALSAASYPRVPNCVISTGVPRISAFPSVFAGAGRSLTAVRQAEKSLFVGFNLARQDISTVRLLPDKAAERRFCNIVAPSLPKSE